MRTCGSSETQSSISAVNFDVEPCEMSASTLERRDAGTFCSVGTGATSPPICRERFLARILAADMFTCLFSRYDHPHMICYRVTGLRHT